MNVVNNWLRDIALAASATECPLDLPDGMYRLVIADGLGAAATRIEVIEAEVVAGTGTLQRGLEGTEDQEWGEGSVIHCTLTAGLLLDILSRLATLEGQVVDLDTRVTALEPVPLNLLLEIAFTAESWWTGDYPVVRSVQALVGTDIVADFDLSLFTQADEAVGASVGYEADWMSEGPAVLIGYNDRLTLIDTGVVRDAGWQTIRVGLGSISSFDGDAAALLGYDPRNELGTASFVRGAGTVYVDIALP